jgi:ubiquinone biosynthesis protein
VSHSERAAAAVVGLPAPGGARPAPRRRVWRRLGLAPLALLCAWALAAVCGRVGLALRAPFSGAASRRARRESWQRRTSQRLARVLGELKGAWAKAGQFAAHRHDVVPAVASSALAGLRDRVPPLPLDEIRGVVEAELGAPLEQRFAEFSPEPLGAASVAQVHRARLPSGEPVAVKVQYPWLEAALPADLALLRAGLALWTRCGRGRGVDAVRLYREFAAGLRDELDFVREASAAAEIARNLRDDPRVLVPRVIASHSGRRVLTMSFQAAVPIGDRAALARLGVAPRDVLEIVARAYAKQVFVDGFFHADPHPGNLFVVDEPGAARAPRVLFVDFGLSRRLEPALRAELRAGLLALVQRDRDAFLAGMQRLGMLAPGAEAPVARALDEMFGRIGAGGGALALRGEGVLALKERAKALLQETPGVQLPNDLLLFAKTLSYLLALGRELDPEVDVVRLCLPYLLRFLSERD